MNDNCDQPWLLYINTLVKDCCISILLLVPSSPRAKHLSPVSPAARWFGAPGPGCAERCWAPEGWEPCKVDHHQTAKAVLCRCIGRLFLHLQLPWLLQSKAVSCTCSWSRQAKDRGGVSGRAKRSITSSGCAFLTQVGVELPGQHW